MFNTIRSVFNFCISRIIAAALMFFSFWILASYFETEVNLTLQIILIILAAIFPVWMYRIVEILIYWIVALFFIRKFTDSSLLQFLIGISVTTIADSIDIIGWIKNLVGYIIGTFLNLISFPIRFVIRKIKGI